MTKITSKILTITLALMLLGTTTTGMSYAQDDFTIEKSASPVDINVSGSGINEITTVTISVSGYGGESITEIDGDIVLVLDESGSVDSSEFSDMIDFAEQLVDSIDFDNTSTQVSIVLFSGISNPLNAGNDFGKKSRTLVTLTNDKTTLTTALATVTSETGYTCIGCGLERAADEFENNGLPGNIPITIVLTDGQNNRPNDSVMPGDEAQELLDAQLLRLSNLNSINVSIGVGSNTDQQELDSIAGDPNRVFSIDDFADLSVLLDQILEDVVVNDAPSLVNLIETTNDYIINHANITPTPDFETTLAGGEKQLAWNDIATNVGNHDSLLEEGETFTVSFEVQSNLIADVLEVNDLTNSEIEFVDADANLLSVPLVQTTINVNGPPTAQDDSSETTEENPIDVDVLVNDSDPQGDSISISSVGVALNGVTSDNSDGTINYSPNSGFVGTDTFEYSIVDEHGLSDSATVTVLVKPLAPVEQKLKALEKLGELIATHGIDKKTSKDLEKSVKDLEKSLDDKFWEDKSASILDSKKGHHAIHEEEKSVKDLMKILKDANEDQAFLDMVQVVIDRIVKADRDLAESAIVNAELFEEPGKVEKELDKAREEFEKGNEKQADDEFDKAIHHYEKAWKHAQKAMKKAIEE